MKGHSESTWVCHNHDGEVLTQTKVTYVDMELMGVPICSECGEDMQFDSEKWVEE